MGSLGVKFISIIFIIPCVLGNVPVLIWNTHETKEVNNAAVSALQQISVASLQARYFNIFKPDNVILFEQDALSIEDLSSHGSEMKHVNKYMRDAGHKLYVPNVAEPEQLQRELIKQGYKVTNLLAGTGVSGLNLDRSVKNLIVVKIPPTITNPSRSRALRKADEVIQSVISKIGDMADFTVIYTGKKTSLNPSSSNMSTRTRVARSLKQIGKELPKNFHSNDKVAMYVRQNMTVRLPGSDQYYPLPEEKSQDEAQGKLGDDEQSIKIKYTDVTIGSESYHSISVEVHFINGSGYYSAPYVVLQSQPDSSGEIKKVTLNRASFLNDGVALGKSFSCNDIIEFTEGTSLNNTDATKLRMNGVQLQAFMKDSSSFGPAWDCVGFFSVGVWAALIVIFITLIMLAFGLFLLGDIKTMDRFDDPKGKSIMVPQASD